MLDISAFKNKYEGKGRTQMGKHQMILNIKGSEEDKIQELTRIIEIKERNGKTWPITVTKLITEKTEVDGVIKNIHPQISEERIWEEIKMHIDHYQK